MLAPRCRTHFYHFVWVSFNAACELLYKTIVVGAENVPPKGPFIIACNHASFLDPPCIGANLPRELTFFARKTLFHGITGQIIRRLNSIPVDRDGNSDIGAFRQVFATLKQGNGILLFPEGTRTPDGKLQKPKDGVGLIACRAQVPVIPTRIFGTYDVFNRQHKLPKPHGKIKINYGKAMMPDAFDPGKQAPQRYLLATQKIMDQISQLKEPKEQVV